MGDRDCIDFLQWGLPCLRLRWPGYRKVRRTVCKRLRRRLRDLDLPDLAAYRGFLEGHPEEWARFDAFCWIPTSRFYRDRGVFNYLADQVMLLLGDAGPWPVIMGLYVLTAMATMIIPTAALVVLMSPIVLSAMADMGLQPETAMMAVAMAASASFTSPISHPANILVMGPGGYRFVDYLKVGVPLTIVVFITVMVLLPILWPLQAA